MKKKIVAVTTKRKIKARKVAIRAFLTEEKAQKMNIPAGRKELETIPVAVKKKKIKINKRPCISNT